MARGVIAISREFGSGGRSIGLLLSELLSIPFYDRELISGAAEAGGISSALVDDYEERVSDDFGAFFLEPGLFACCLQQPMTDRIYLAQRRVVLELAERGPCIIVGRCAAHILGDRAVSVFVRASIESRIERIRGLRGGVSVEEARALVLSVDKRRRRYYERYTGLEWGRADDYNLCIDTTGLDLKGCAGVIKSYFSCF